MKFDHNPVLDTMVARQRWAKVRVRVTGLLILLSVIAFPTRWFLQQWNQNITPDLEVEVPPLPPLIVPDAIVVSQIDDQRQLNHALQMDRAGFMSSFPALLSDDVPEQPTVNLSEAYILELETLNDFAKASAVVAGLRERGFRAFVSLVDPLQPMELAHFKVVVGPELRKAQIDEWSDQFLKEGFNPQVKLWSVGDTNRIESLPSKKESS